MTVFLQCAETQGSCDKNPNWDKCLCNGCITYRRQLRNLRYGYVGLDPAKAAGLKAAQESLAKLYPPCLTCGGTTAHEIGCPEGERTRERLLKNSSVSDGSTASYYELPPGATELQDLISFRNMNAQLGEIFRACYRYGQASHSSCLRDAKKIQFYINAEIERLERWGQE